MAAKKNKKKDVIALDATEVDDDFSKELISALNKEFQEKIAYNLSSGESPTHVKRWISTRCQLLDYAVANRRHGGCPEGRIIEIYGEPSTGKSHIAFSMARTVQELGGLVVYIDTENATPVDKLADMGIDVSKRFVYCDTHMTEEVFKIVESTIKKAALINSKKNIPILVVWDSVAATSPKAELEGDYDDNTIGLQARVISKAMRKITGIIGKNNVTFVCLNQTRTKIGVAFGDPTTTPGGKSIPFHASVRIALTGGSAVKNKDGEVIGIRTYATIKKNKVGPPFRRVEFDILFGKGLYESETVLDLLSEKSKSGAAEITLNGNIYNLTTGIWRELTVTNETTGEVIFTQRFQKPSFHELLTTGESAVHFNDMIEAVMVIDTKPSIDNIAPTSSPEEKTKKKDKNDEKKN